MTAVNESYSSVACLAVLFPPSTTVTAADSPTSVNPDAYVPADDYPDEVTPDDAAERTEEPDPADSFRSLFERITIALVPKASSLLAVLRYAVLVLLSLIPVDVTIVHSRDALAFALMLLAVALCYGLRNDSDDHAFLSRQANQTSVGRVARTRR